MELGGTGREQPLSTAAREPRTWPHQQKLRTNTRTKERGKTGPGGEPPQAPKFISTHPRALAQWCCTALPGSWGGTSAGCGCDGHQPWLPTLQQPAQMCCPLYLCLLQGLPQDGHRGLALLPTQVPQAITSHVCFSFPGAGPGAHSEQHHPSEGTHIKSQDPAKAGRQQEEVSFNSCLFPEERLYSTNHSNKLPAIRLAICSSHSGFSFLKGPVALHNIHSL